MKKKAAGRTKNQFGKNEVRKRAAVMNLTWLVVWLLSFAGMAVFYELKCQAVIGAVYQSNPSAGILVTNHMFMAKINYVHTTESIETCGAEVQKGNAPTERKMQIIQKTGSYKAD